MSSLLLWSRTRFRSADAAAHITRSASNVSRSTMIGKPFSFRTLALISTDGCHSHAARFCIAPAAASSVSGFVQSERRGRYTLTTLGSHNVAIPWLYSPGGRSLQWTKPIMTSLVLYTYITLLILTLLINKCIYIKILTCVKLYCTYFWYAKFCWDLFLLESFFFLLLLPKQPVDSIKIKSIQLHIEIIYPENFRKRCYPQS